MTVREHVAADVDEHDEVAVEVGGGGREAVGDDGRAGVGVDEHDERAEQGRHVRLREQEAAGAGGLGAGERDGGVDHLGAGQLVDAAGARQRVDRTPLPADAADDGVAAEGAAALRDGEGADDVAAAADADREGATAAEDLFDAGCRRVAAMGHRWWGARRARERDR